MASRTLIEAFADSRRAPLLAEIEKRIEAAGVTHVYLQYTCVPGRVMGKVVPARYFARFAQKGIPWANVAAGGFTVALSGDLIGPEAVPCSEGLLVPDLTTFQLLPWDTDMARVICDHYNAPDGRTNPGVAAPSDPRSNLRQDGEPSFLPDSGNTGPIQLPIAFDSGR